MKRLLSRHMVVALLVLTTSVLGGLSLAVVAFGQGTSTDPDATVPVGDYTGTTPSTSTTTSTAPLSGYTTTTPTTTTTTTTSTSTTETTSPTSTTEGTTTTGGTKGATAHGRRDVTIPSGGGTQPSKATGRAPTKLAFTGGEPILIGAFGAALMLTGVALHERRRRRASGEL
ncbi:hypothetical protein [Conexibacter woesei]|uniref:hypothetical protein n=1 Tax=Conexibacter woesei TaxID=191495 RepID=UPI0012DDB79B|nr:hypothetical protein [Conexibacter woesei]